MSSFLPKEVNIGHGMGMDFDESNNNNESSHYSMSESGYTESETRQTNQHHHSNTNTDDDGFSESTLARRETIQVKKLRRIVLFSLTCILGLVSWGMYHIINTGQETNFHQSQIDQATKVIDTIHWNIEQKLSAVDSLSISITSYATLRRNLSSSSSSWPMITLPDFHIRGASTRSLSDATSILFLPLVTSDTRLDWEEYSTTMLMEDESMNWIEQGYRFEQYGITKQHQEERTTATRKTRKLSNNNNNNDENDKKTIISNTQISTWDTNTNQMIPMIDDDDEDTSQKRNTTDPYYYFPIWQSSPVIPELVNFDLSSNDEFQKGIQAMLYSKQAVIGKVWDLGVSSSSSSESNGVFQALERQWNAAAAAASESEAAAGTSAGTGTASTDDNNGIGPVSKLFFPIMDRLMIPTGPSSTTNVVGLLTALLNWESYLTDILPDDSAPVDVVLENACDQIYTYRVIGQTAVYVGNGDHHDRRYDDMVLSAALTDDLWKRQEAGGGGEEQVQSYHRIDMNTEFCTYMLHVYPTRDMEQKYMNALPIYFSMTVGAITIFTIFIICCYDYQVDRRQRLTMSKVKQAGAIVSSLFPAAVRKRLMNQSPTSSIASRIRRRNRHGRNPNGPKTMTTANNNLEEPSMARRTSTKTSIKGFLSNFAAAAEAAAHSAGHAAMIGTATGGGHEEEEDQHHRDSNNNTLGLARCPIADTFAETTILFADIDGFAPWSSERDPQQVFTLLQTLYYAFDTIARKCKVFKVETVGECYVAATGLPEPQADHAVRMTKFARLCMLRMTELTRQLEITLGPDTGELRLKVGMHSGSVTAGVLQGAKARFQLFGDTVNMASRMESNGLGSRIHCSESTAKILQDAGKEHWVRMRDEMVQVKGKGKVTTYWVKPCSGPFSVDNDTTSLNVSEAIGEEDSDIVSVGSSYQSSGRVENAAQAQVIINLSMQSSRQQRLVEWSVRLLTGYLKQIAAQRIDSTSGKSRKKASATPPLQPQRGKTAMDEVTESISLPKFDDEIHNKTKTDPESILLSPLVMDELHDYITTIASMYRDNFFHNFEHASHVAQSTTKLLTRIVRSDENEQLTAQDLHDYTHGLATDPLTQFALIFCALVHDVDHPGVSNFALIAENTTLARYYKNESIAEQNSVDLSWDLLMDPAYSHLQQAIYSSQDELKRFRQLVVNIVLATDIFDKDMKAIREMRWDKAFHNLEVNRKPEVKWERANLKATIVLEHLIQASDVSHTMQHFDIYMKWNERLFMEMKSAYDAGHMGNKDPAESWYEGEIWFFDKCIIPLARKLDECGCFGVSSDEYLTYAKQNRKEWANRGDRIVEEFKARYNEKRKRIRSASIDFNAIPDTIAE